LRPFSEPANRESRITRKEASPIAIYIPNDQYNAAVNTIAEKTGVDPDGIKIALGEEGNIWPSSIKENVTP
jgi:hypothetical protein